MDIQLTIDWRIQKYLDDALAGYIGAAVVIDSADRQCSGSGKFGRVLTLIFFVKYEEKNKIRDFVKR